MLEARDLTIRRRGRLALDAVTLALAPGEVLAVCGPNGAGKSTLWSALAGDLAPDAGACLIDGDPVRALPAAELARRRAALEQTPSLSSGFTARELAGLGLISRRTPPAEAAARVARALAAAGLAGMEDRQASELSGGERARAHFARALVQVESGREAPGAVPGGRYLLLDEPTAALDLARQAQAMRLARRAASEGTGVLAVLHDLNLAAAFADRIALLGAGRLVICAAPEAALESARLSALYGAPIRVERAASGRPVVIPDLARA